MRLTNAPSVRGSTWPYCCSAPKVLPLRMLPNSQTQAPFTRARVKNG